MDENGKMDIGLKFTIAVATAVAGGSMIVIPNKKQKDVAALDLYDQPFARLNPTQQRTAEFKAGHDRWSNFIEKKWYPITRKLPGANNPVLNPYRDQEPLGGGGDDDDEL